ncbi:MAG: S-methyl-5-thioribose-1-phosphate isomerase, partial [Pseudomonadota bacterium]|nr:S-methyl-5-thioribose-1-phosphate isomerase [Pseudomonadota bacterium]
MKVNGKPMRTIWPAEDGWAVEIIDQTQLPHRFVTCRLTTMDEAAHAISTMQVRGAPLIGATAAYGVYLGLRGEVFEGALDAACDTLIATRPTAINLRWALDEMCSFLTPLAAAEREAAAYARAGEICDEDVAICHHIGINGLPLIIEAAKGKPAGEAGHLKVLFVHVQSGALIHVCGLGERPRWAQALRPPNRAPSPMPA